jgi:hypothetical protein
MIKKAFLLITASFYVGIASAGITFLSSSQDGKIGTICIEGYVVVVSEHPLLQLLDSDGNPLTCKSQLHESINR